MLGYKPRMPVGLISISSSRRSSVSVDLFARHIHALHDEIKRRINMHNGSDKTPADAHCCRVELNIGDYVMIRGEARMDSAGSG